MDAADREASRTALGVAALRAAHRELDQEPWLLDDPVAIRLLESGARERFVMDRERLEHPVAKALRSHVLLRSRYAEDRLMESLGEGVRQCVILGAGFDTFAYRQPPCAQELRIFEVDHPASQAAKRERVRAAGLDHPRNLVHAPVDFEQVPLREGLRQAGFDESAPAFFTWLGVTMYLSRAAIAAVFQFVGALPPRSRLVLTFAQPDGEGDGTSRLAELAASAGEPWLTRFTPGELMDDLRAAGFSKVSILSPEEALDRYYRGRGDGLPAPRRASIALAEV